MYDPSSVAVIAFVVTNWSLPGDTTIHQSERMLRNTTCEQVLENERDFGVEMIERGVYDYWRIQCQDFKRAD